MRSISTIFLLFISIYTLFAVKAYPKAINVQLPDGSELTLLVKGDEYFRYMTTTSGQVVSQGRDGFYYYADYSNGKLNLSNSRVGRFNPTSFRGGVKGLSQETAKMIRENNIRRFNEATSHTATLSSGLQRNFVDKTVKVPVLIVQFNDVKFSVPSPVSHFDKMLNMNGYSENGATGSANDYFKANFPSEYSFQFDISNVITLDHPLSYYGYDDESVPSVIKYDVNMPLLIKDACTICSTYMDFSKYDIDRDGVVDRIFIIFAGYNEAEGGGKNTIWPHTWSVEKNNLKFNGVKIGTYGCTSELKGASNAIPAGIGTFCHEMSHSFGLKDLYDVNLGAKGKSKCLWQHLSIMDEGNYNNEGKTPPYYCAIDRELADFASFLTIYPGYKVVLKPIHIPNSKIVRVDTGVEGEYFLMENREKVGWDLFIGGNGMIIYHIDKSNNNAGGIRANVRWQNNIINTDYTHECADLVESMDDATNISQVFFPGQGDIRSFTPIGSPPFTDWRGDGLGIKLVNITQKDGEIIFDVAKDSTERLFVPKSLSVNSYQKEAMIKWSSDVVKESKWGVILMKKNADNQYIKVEEVSTLKMSYTFKNLTHNSDYLCSVFYKGKISNGDTLSTPFTTMGYSSLFPFIMSQKQIYEVGDTVLLKVLNITEKTQNETWYIDGVFIDNEIYVLKKEGINELKTVLTYSADGSKETITRYIKVRPKTGESK